LHGRGNAASTWFPLLPALAKRWRVVAVDLPGFGGSRARLDPAARGLGALAYFVDPIEALLVSLDLDRPLIAGHSLGAFVAVELALRGKIAPSKLALIGAMGLGPAMSLGARAFFRLGPERLARALGPVLFARLHGQATTPLGRRLDALGYELYSIPGGRP